MDAKSSEDVYEENKTRLARFLREEDNWDGYGGQPASWQTWHETTNFLNECQRIGIPAPYTYLDNKGTITLTWDQDDWIIAGDFYGKGTYWLLGLKKSGKDIQPRFNETLKVEDISKNIVRVLINKEDVKELGSDKS